MMRQEVKELEKTHRTAENSRNGEKEAEESQREFVERHRMEAEEAYQIY